MSWFKRAVEVKTVTERVEVPVVGEAKVTPLYAVDVPTGEKVNRYKTTIYGGYYAVEDELAPKYYATCEQAHAAHPGRQVKQAKAIRIGREYFLVNSLSDIKVEPKPKVAKGKRGSR